MNFNYCLILCLVVLAVQLKCYNAANLDIRSPFTADLSYQYFQLAVEEFENSTSVLSASVSQTCQTDIKKIFSAILKYEEWALEFPDSWGRLPVGALWGHVRSYGGYRECIAANNPLNQNIAGKYCLSNLPITQFMQKVIPRNETTARLNYKKQTPTIFELGVCVPKTCTAVETNAILKTVLRSLYDVPDVVYNEYTMVSENYCKTNEPIKLRPLDIFAICVFSFFGFCLIASSIYDYIKTKKNEPKNNLLMAFSVLTNAPKIFTVKKVNNPNIIHCLSGLRACSMMWVVYGHGYLTYYQYPHVNYDAAYTWLRTPYSILVQNATLCVDTFFFMSGLLVLWGAFREMEKTKGKLNIPLMYFHRYIRLTPVVAATLLYIVTFYKYSGEGPMWMKIGTQDLRCEQYWWTTLLYIQNYANPYYICMSQSWYLAVDTQLYVLSPLVLIPLWKWGKKFIYPCFLLVLLCMGCMFATFMVNDFTMFRIDDNHVDMRQAKTYYPTHTRVPSWLLGVIFGYFLYTKNRGVKIPLAKIYVILGWIVALGGMFCCMWAPFWRQIPGTVAVPIIDGALYESLSRPAWDICIAWIIWACYNGHGGIINDFLSWDFFTALSRLSYCMYVTHRIVQYVNGGRIQTDTIFDNYDYILRWWSDFGITLTISSIATLVFEVPILHIEKAIFSHGTVKLKPTSEPNVNKTEIPSLEFEKKKEVPEV